VAVASFVCSIGNVPLAAVLWNGGISFGGVVSFIFADLIIIPIVHIYRRYYARRAAWLITWAFYVSMVAAGFAIELIFQALVLVPGRSTPRKRRRDLNSLELHERPQHHLPRPRRAPAVALLHHRRPDHVVDDGRRPRRPVGISSHSEAGRRARTGSRTRTGLDLIASGDSHRRARPLRYPRGFENVLMSLASGSARLSLTHALGACV
jgi:hypothetical protein